MQGFQKKEASVIGEGCELGDKVTLKQCCVAPGARVGARSKINNCIIMEGVSVGEK
jgi:translation initiation factor eIF-2B subunit gamma